MKDIDEDEVEAFNLMATKFHKFFRKGNRSECGNRFGNEGNRFGRGCGNGFGNKGGGSSRQKHECYNCREEVQVKELKSEKEGLKLSVEELTKAREFVEATLRQRDEIDYAHCDKMRLLKEQYETFYGEKSAAADTRSSVNTIQASNVDSVVMENTYSGKDNSLSKEDLKDTRIEHGFKRAFMSLFGQDVETFTSMMFLNVDQLQKQLDKDEFQEDGSMAAFWVLNNQFQQFIDSWFSSDYDSQMTSKYFVEYTRIKVKHFRDTLLQHMGNVKKSVAERTRHQRQYNRRVNKRQMQTQESKVDTGKALDADLVVIENSGTESGLQDESIRSGNDIDADDADMRPIYDEEPMAEVQLTAELPKSNDLIPPTQGIYLPEIRKELKICEAKTDKSSIDKPPEVELKDLPPHLEYAFLEGDNNFPIIIARDLSVEEKAALIKVLKPHKRAIAWKLFDIKGINPEFYTHKILMEEDYKPAVQHQRRVNPKIHDVIKKEVEKLLDARLIYPISDSPWVSPVHCIPKKGGFTVVENDENELIPTRLVTGWRVCIDYRKLNEATRKDHFLLPFIDQMLERLAGNDYYCFLDGFSSYF
ncbi:hypothetical protein Tco_0175456 [Tanacetum coccineum]